MKGTAIVGRAIVFGQVPVVSDTLHTEEEAGNLDNVPSCPPISGNGVMARADQVIEYANYRAFITSLKMMFDDR
jgi:hypothetical protein